MTLLFDRLVPRHIQWTEGDAIMSNQATRSHKYSSRYIYSYPDSHSTTAQPPHKQTMSHVYIGHGTQLVSFLMRMRMVSAEHRLSYLKAGFWFGKAGDHYPVYSTITPELPYQHTSHATYALSETSGSRERRTSGPRVGRSASMMELLC